MHTKQSTWLETSSAEAHGEPMHEESMHLFQMMCICSEINSGESEVIQLVIFAVYFLTMNLSNLLKIASNQKFLINSPAIYNQKT